MAGERCHTCHKVGHFAICCRSKLSTSVKKLPSDRGKRGNVLSVLGYQCSFVSPSCSAVYAAHTRAVDVDSLVGPTSSTIKLQVQAGDRSGWLECMPATGADTTIMDNEILNALDLQPLMELGLNNPDGWSMACPIPGLLYASMMYGVITIQG